MVPMALFLGVICGLLGSIINILNSKLAYIRKTRLTSKPLRVIEAVLFALVTTSAFYWLPHAVNECKPLSGLEPRHLHLVVQGLCKDNEYSSMASLLYNTEADAIKAIMSGWAAEKGIVLTASHMGMYLALWFFFTIVTYGVWVPAGTFLPAIIIGCAIGSIY